MSPRKILMTILVLAAVAIASYTAFRLFEPVLTYTSGWTELPRDGAAPVKSETLDPAWSEAASAAEAALLRGRAQAGAPAYSAAVAVDGAVVWRAAAGYADMDARTPIGFDDRFRIGSSSKAVTAVAVGVLVDRGVLDLDAPMTSFAPDLPAAFKAISVRQAMSHRAGVRNYGLCLCLPIWEHQNQRKFKSVRESVGVIEDDKLLFEPGAGFEYTSLGYNLAGLAIEAASGEPYGAFVQSDVFAPLNMTRSALDSNGDALKTVAFYEVSKGRYKPAFRVDNSIRWPSGGIVSTPTDMTRLGGVMLEGGLLSKETQAALVNVPKEGASGAGAKYALGWRVGQWDLPDGSSRLVYHHNGTAVGSTSFFMVLPQERLVISLMTNKGAESAEELAVTAKEIVAAFVKSAP